MKISDKVICSEFVKRQTADSRFSHTSLSWDEVVEITKKQLNKRNERLQKEGDLYGDSSALDEIKGYREGVLVLPVPANGFYCALAKVEDVKEWEDVYEARQEGEEKVLTRVGIVDKKPEAKLVDIILYHVDVLAEDEDYVRHGDHDWEIISINSRMELKQAPIPPMTMARNFLVKKGGTKAEYTAQEFADSIWFWNKHCLVKEKGN